MATRSRRSLSKASPAAEILFPSGKTLAEVRPVLGPAWIIKGEDSETYERLLGEVGKAIGPRDLVDWQLINDVVALTWEIQRSRRLSASLLRSSRPRSFFPRSCRRPNSPWQRAQPPNLRTMGNPRRSLLPPLPAGLFALF